jgi:hypothetical protein
MRSQCLPRAQAGLLGLVTCSAQRPSCQNGPWPSHTSGAPRAQAATWAWAGNHHSRLGLEAAWSSGAVRFHPTVIRQSHRDKTSGRRPSLGNPSHSSPSPFPFHHAGDSGGGRSWLLEPVKKSAAGNRPGPLSLLYLFSLSSPRFLCPQLPVKHKNDGNPSSRREEGGGATAVPLAGTHVRP